ncbi:MAG: XdhC family protein [Dokdonella sp.]
MVVGSNRELASTRIAGGNRGVIEAAITLRKADQSFALLLVVHAAGSTYRKPGALAAVSANGERFGTLSGGCLEPAIAMLAQESLRLGIPKSADFDTRDDDDLVFGSGSGCRGLMRVVAVPIAPGQVSIFDDVVKAFEKRQPLTLPLVDIAPELFEQGAATIFPPPSLLLFGAGPEMPVLAALARALGWFVNVVDHRSGLLSAERIIEVDHWIAARPAAGFREFESAKCDAAIVMTHQAGADGEALRTLAASNIAYIGLLGPPARRDELLAQLETDERASLAARLRAPVGIALGGEGPEAIALSIVADLQRWFASRA